MRWFNLSRSSFPILEVCHRVGISTQSANRLQQVKKSIPPNPLLNTKLESRSLWSKPTSSKLAYSWQQSENRNCLGINVDISYHPLKIPCYLPGILKLCCPDIVKFEGTVPFMAQKFGKIGWWLIVDMLTAKPPFNLFSNLLHFWVSFNELLLRKAQNP